jgi:hypothetical protein
MTDQFEPFQAVLHTGSIAAAYAWAREHHVPRRKVTAQISVDHLRGMSRVLVVGDRVEPGERLKIPQPLLDSLATVPSVVVWDGVTDVRYLLGLSPEESPQQHWINAAIEVCPDEAGGWKVTEYTGQANTPRVLARPRTKRTAVLIGRGAAMVWKCELRVKNAKGRYTRESTSYAGTGLPR